MVKLKGDEREKSENVRKRRLEESVAEERKERESEEKRNNDVPTHCSCLADKSCASMCSNDLQTGACEKTTKRENSCVDLKSYSAERHLHALLLRLCSLHSLHTVATRRERG